MLTQEEVRDRLTAAHDVSRDDFNLWRHHPVTRVVLRLLADQGDAVKHAALTAFLGGALTALQDNELRGRLMQINELLQLSWDDVVAFYMQRLMPEEGERP